MKPKAAQKPIRILRKQKARKARPADAIEQASDSYLVGYARVSTDDQELDGQVRALERSGCGTIFREKISATSKRRHQLDLAIKSLQPGDVLVVFKLDRIARDNRELNRRIDQIKAAGATFRSLTENIETETAAGKAMFGMLGVMAQFERDVIIERTRNGIRAAQERGIRFGAKTKFTAPKQAAARKMLKRGMMARAIGNRLGVSASTIYQFKAKIRK